MPKGFVPHSGESFWRDNPEQECLPCSTANMRWAVKSLGKRPHTGLSFLMVCTQDKGCTFGYGRQVRICFSQRAEVEEKVVAQKASDDEAPRLTSSRAIDQGAKEIT